MLPLLRDKVSTLEMQYHCMQLNKDIVNIVNPGQIVVDACDQPVYALTKEVQLRFPEIFKNYFSLPGGLHVEHCALIMHGQLIDGSGLAKILNLSSLSTIGTKDVVDANHIKRARYCLQVSLCALYMKLKEAVGKVAHLCLL